MKVHSILKEIMVNDPEASAGYKRSPQQYVLSQLDEQTNALVNNYHPDQVRIEDTVTSRKGDGAAIYAVVLRKVIFE